MAKSTTHPQDPKPRLLFIVSKDYGELCWAMSFLQGQEFADRTTLMLPQQMYAGNEGSLSIKASPYSTVEDIFEAVDTDKPSVVLLLSGYLLSNDELIPRAALKSLVSHLQEKVSVVATSDPFNGLSSHLTETDIDTDMVMLGKNLIERTILRIVFRFRPIDRFIRNPTLENLTHLYATFTPPADDQAAGRRLSFFNPNILNLPTGTSGAAGSTAVAATSEKRWLFVLSSTDLEIQNAILGKPAFSRSVIRMLAQALESGRKPTMLAPAKIIDILAAEFPPSTGVELLLFCPYTEFVSRLLDAEYVFYWNVFSCSLLLRMANELPIFFFDRGHLSRTIIPFYDFALRTHFGEWTPTFLDQEGPLETSTLADLAAQQKPALRAVREYWQSSPTPDQVINQMLENAGHRKPIALDYAVST